MNYIAFDSHKKYTLASVEPCAGGKSQETRIEHERGAIREFLSRQESGSSVAIEAIGNWYWIVDEIEEARMVPHLVHARKAKLMMGMMNKTDKLDAQGLNRLQRNRTLPVVWIPPAELRDQRELIRTRMVLTAQRARIKNRLHATLAKYALHVEDTTDIFAVGVRQTLKARIKQLPPQTAFASQRLLEQLESLQDQIKAFEQRIQQLWRATPELKLITSMPGIGNILGMVLWLEIGDISRFPSAGHLAAYSGTTPRVHSSGGKTRYGQVRSDVNQYLKWAFVEAANVICRHRRHDPQRHVCRLYERIKNNKGHQKAIGAVARHLAEASYWILSRKEPYRDPALRRFEGISAGGL